MKVKLSILEFNETDFSHIPLREAWTLPLGSSPKYAGEVVEGLKVPEGKVWLFPLGNDVQRLRQSLARDGKLLECVVDV